jgi:hypothetical protein
LGHSFFRRGSALEQRAVSPVTVLKKPLKVEQVYQAVKIIGHSGPSWELEQQSSRASGEDVTWPLK